MPKELAKSGCFFLVKERHRDKLWKIVLDILGSSRIHIDIDPGQAKVHHANPKDCPLPCTKNSGCHTAVKGESCYSAVKWVRFPAAEAAAEPAASAVSSFVTLQGQEEWNQTAPHLAGDPKGFQLIPRRFFRGEHLYGVRASSLDKPVEPGAEVPRSYHGVQLL